MPNRILRDGVLTSPRIHRLIELAGWEGEVFYKRLLSVVDDFGCYSAVPALLRAHMYPLELEKMREANVSRCLAMCEEAGLVRLYSVADKPYLMVLDFNQRLRAKHQKYPLPEHDGHVTVTRPASALGGADGDGGGKPPTPEGECVGFDRFWAEWPGHPRKVDKKSCLIHWRRHGLESKAEEILSGLAASRRSRQWLKDNGDFIPAPLVWLRKECWVAANECKQATVDRAASVADRDAARRAAERADEARTRQLAEEARRVVAGLDPERLATVTAEVLAAMPVAERRLLEGKDPKVNPMLRQFVYDRVMAAEVKP